MTPAGTEVTWPAEDDRTEKKKYGRDAAMLLSQAPPTGYGCRCRSELAREALWEITDSPASWLLQYFPAAETGNAAYPARDRRRSHVSGIRQRCRAFRYGGTQYSGVPLRLASAALARSGGRKSLSGL
ncbi:hypothetical protein D9M71_256010 [compost metagenome]